MFNMARVLELTLFGGADPQSGVQMGLATPALNEMTSFEELQRCYDKQTQHFIRQASFKSEADDFGFLIPSPTQPVTLGQVCFLIMQTQKMKGGLLYSLFPGPHYATRELASQGLLKGYTHPNRVVSGEEVMWILGAVLDLKEKA